MKGKYKILTALMLITLVSGVGMAEPSDFDRIDDEGENVGESTVTHVPNNGGTLYYNDSSDTLEFEVKVDVDSSHEINDTDAIGGDVQIWDEDNDTVYLESKDTEWTEGEGEDNITDITYTYENDVEYLNNTLDMDEDLTFDSSSDYRNSAEDEKVELQERTWFTATDDSIDYAISLILALVPVFMVMIVLQELKTRKQ